MGRPRKYATAEEAHQAKLAQAREKYRLSRIGIQRKKWGFINMIITQDMIGKSIKQLEQEYKDAKQKAKQQSITSDEQHSEQYCDEQESNASDEQNDE